jgi:SAM-dependent methyltransferase
MIDESESLRAMREAYDAIAPVYAERFRDSLNDRPLERALLSAFAEMVTSDIAGPVADVGCGPGYVTAHLHALGLDAYGIDASAAMIELARSAYPSLRFEVGSMGALDVADGALGGVLSRASTIHTPPAELPAILAELRRVLSPGGYLLISFVGNDGPSHPTQTYDHTVSIAYRRSGDHLSELLRTAGLGEVARLVCLPKPTDRRQFEEIQLLARAQ